MPRQEVYGGSMLPFMCALQPQPVTSAPRHEGRAYQDIFVLIEHPFNRPPEAGFERLTFLNPYVQLSQRRPVGGESPNPLFEADSRE